MHKFWSPNWEHVTEETLLEPTPPSSHIAEFGFQKYVKRFEERADE